MEDAKALIKQGRVREAEELLQQAPDAHQAGLLALKHGQPQMAARLLRRAVERAPKSAEVRHDLGLALLESGDVGLAALAQREAVLLEPSHTGARAQLAAALEAIGDDAGAARELSELLHSLGPQPALAARMFALEGSAQRAAQRRLLGNSPARLSQSPLIGSALARALGSPLTFRAPFAELRATAEGVISRLDFVFDSMDASMGRSDMSYGGTVQEEDGRRVPLDEFTAAGIVFLAEALGIETVRARRLLSLLLTPECGLGPLPVAGVKVGWTITGGNGDRQYGLFAEL